MSGSGDVPSDMTGAPTPDDRTADRLLRGRAVDGHAELAAFVTGLSELRSDPPEPRGELALLLAHGLDPATTRPVDVPAWPAVPRRSWGRPAARVGRLSVAAKVLLGSVVAVAGMTSAAGAGMLPAPVQDGVAEVVRTITPFEIPSSTSTPPATTTDDDPAPSAPREDDVVPRSQPEPSAVSTSPQPTAKPSPTAAPTRVPAPSATPTPTTMPSESASPDPSTSPATDAPSPSGSPTGEAAGADEPVEAAPTPRGNGGPEASRSPGVGSGRPSKPPVER